MSMIRPTPTTTLALRSLSFAPPAMRWRTEAMRSYDRPVLIWFTRGQGRLTIAGRSSGYSPHNLVFLPKQSMHGFTTMGPVLGSVVFLPGAQEYDWPGEPMHLRIHEAQSQRELTGMIEAMPFGSTGRTSTRTAERASPRSRLARRCVSSLEAICNHACWSK